MQTCPKCNTLCEDGKPCPVCGETFVPAQSLTAFLDELRQERESLERQKAEQSAQISFELKEQKSEAAPTRPVRTSLAKQTHPWCILFLFLLAAAAVACSVLPCVYKTGVYWVSSFEEILLLLKNSGAKPFTEGELFRFAENLPENLCKGQTVFAIGICSFISVLSCAVMMVGSFFTHQYRVGVKWTLFPLCVLAILANAATLVLIVTTYGQNYIGYGLALQTAVLVAFISLLCAMYVKRKKVQT